MTLRLMLAYRHGKLQKRCGPKTGRNWADLVSHLGEMAIDDKVEVRRIVQSHYLTFPLVYEADKLTSDRMIEIYAKCRINSHVIHEFSPNGHMIAIGAGLCLDVSAFDHSCRPNAMYSSVGRTLHILPVEPGVDANRGSGTRVRYVDLTFPRTIRRAVLRRDQYFICDCCRCHSPASDSALTAMKCAGCGIGEGVPVPIPLTENSDFSQLVCGSCGHQAEPDEVWTAYRLMENLAALVGFPNFPTTIALEGEPQYGSRRHSRRKPTTFADLLALQSLAESILSARNVFYCRLLRKIGDSALASPETRARFWHAHLKMLIDSYPRNWGQVILEESIRTIHALLHAEMFAEAEPILSQIETTARLVWFDRPCPFSGRLAYLLRCQTTGARACDPLLAEFRNDTSDWAES